MEQAMSSDRPLALVTGAAGGIGTGVSRMLARRGYQVIVVDRDKDIASQAAATVAPDAIAVACDATDRAAVEALSGRIRSEWAERLEVIVCNAGVIIPGDAADARPADLWLQADVMLTSCMQFLSAAASVMKARGRGRILATVSMGGILALPGSAAYSAGKAGLRAFLAALSAELVGTGVKVAGVYPSGVDTPMLRHEARHGGSMLNFLGAIYTVDDVVRTYERAIDGRRLEVYLPYGDSISTRLASTVPGWTNRLIPLLERLGRKGHARYLARINAEDARRSTDDLP
ncbi:MAG: SDR family oxidoreductase [Pseudoxanthomonas sp.]|nr:SDR family oxidoreductase [Pseudoxanthomonas sp.]